MNCTTESDERTKIQDKTRHIHKKLTNEKIRELRFANGRMQKVRCILFNTVGPHLIDPYGTEDFSPLKRGEITLKTFIWDLKMLTFIDWEPLSESFIAGSHCIFFVVKCET